MRRADTKTDDVADPASAMKVHATAEVPRSNDPSTRMAMSHRVRGALLIVILVGTTAQRSWMAPLWEAELSLGYGFRSDGDA